LELLRKDFRDGYIYDGVIKQFDTAFWKQTAGTTTMSTNKLLYNAAATASYIQHEFADVEFALTVPAVPTSGDLRHWGLRAPASLNFGATYFDVAGTVFSCKVVDNVGNAYSKTVVWSAAWTAVETLFRIVWEPDRIQFLAGVVTGGVVAYTVLATFDTLSNQIPLIALPLRISNGNSDNLLCAYVAVRRAAGIV
jgi:hypothetical protein